MLGKEARRRNRQRDVREFLGRFCPTTLDKTRCKFFRQALGGVLGSGSLVVARWLRHLHGCGDRCHDPFYRHKRLLNQLHSEGWDHARVLEEYQRQWAGQIDPDTPIIVDLSDLAKPRARKLEYLALVRDGSNSDGRRPRLVNGYWCLEVYADLGGSRVVPLLLLPYSVEDPQVLSENAMVLRGVEQVFAATGGKGVLVMDIGGDRDAVLIPWVDDGRRFVVRLRGDRHLLLDDGGTRTRVEALQLAETLLQRRHGQSRRAWCRVYLPERPNHPLALVCVTLPGHDRPLMVLTNLCAEDDASAARVLRYYRRRWKCEEAIRFLKSELGLERFAVRRYAAFGRLMLLATLAMALLTWLQLHFASLARSLREQRPGRHAIKFLYYRLAKWFQEQIPPGLPSAAPP
jgi:hypothetical protein